MNNSSCFSKYAPKKRASVSVQKVRLDLAEDGGSSVSPQNPLEKELENTVERRQKLQSTLRELLEMEATQKPVRGRFAPGSPAQKREIVERIQERIAECNRGIARINGELKKEKEEPQPGNSFPSLYKSEYTDKSGNKPSDDNKDIRGTRDTVPDNSRKAQQSFEEEQSRIFEEQARIEDDRFQMQMLREEEMWEEEEREEMEEEELDPFWDKDDEF